MGAFGSDTPLSGCMSENVDQAIRDIVKGAGIVYAGLILQAGIAFLAQVLAARFLTTSGFGGIVVGTALLDIGTILGGLGLAEGLIRYLPRSDDDERGGIVLTSLAVSLLVSSLLAVLVVLNATFLAVEIFDDPEIAINIKIFGAAIPFATLLFVAIGGIRGQKVPRYRVYVQNIGLPSLRFLLIAGAVAFGLGQIGVAGAYTIPYVVAGLAATFLLYRTLSPAKLRSVGLSSMPSDMFSYSLPFVVHLIAGFLYRSADIFLLLYFLDSGTVGTYGVAYASARLLLLFPSAINFLGGPVASELESTDGIGAVLEVQFKAVRWLTIVTIPALVPLVVFAPDFIEVVYGPRYVSGSLALAALAIGFAVHNLFSVQVNLFRAVGSSTQLASASSFGALLNIGLNLVLIPPYGILGAAIATMAAYLAIDGLLFVYLYYRFGKAPVSPRALPPIAISLPLFGLLLVVRPLVPTSIGALIGISAAFGVLYSGVVLVVLGLDSAEVMLIRSVEERLGVEFWIVDWILERFS